MLREYIAINSLIRALIIEITEIYLEDASTMSPDLSEIRKEILEKLWELREVLPREFDHKNLDERFKFISNLDDDNVESLGLGSLHLVNSVLKQLEIIYSNKSEPELSNEILDLLHPIIIEKAYHHFINGHYRDAVFNAIVAVFELIRQRTKLDSDGAELVREVFAPKKTILVLSTLHSETGRSEQSGFYNLLMGAYSTFRNPIAHSLLENPNRSETAQKLIFASFLAKRIEGAKFISEDQP
jgi:uncharacterized protein (TIGR02391 family)